MKIYKITEASEYLGVSINTLPDVYEDHNIDNLYFRVVSEDSILVEVKFDI